MPIRLACPCGVRLKISDDKIGTEIQCPKCSAKILVPAANDAEEETAPTMTRGGWVARVLTWSAALGLIVSLAPAVIVAHTLGTRNNRQVEWDLQNQQIRDQRRQEEATREAVELRRLVAAKNPVELLALSPDGKLLLSSGPGQITRLWNVADGKFIRPFRIRYTRSPGGLTFTPDGKSFLLFVPRWVGPKSCMLWGLEGGVQYFNLEASAPVYLPDGRLLVDHRQRQLVTWNPEADPPLQDFLVDGKPLPSVFIGQPRLSPDGKRILVQQGNALLVLAVESGKKLATFDNLPGIQAQAFDDQHIFVATVEAGSNVLQVFRRDEPGPLLGWNIRGGNIKAVALAGAGKLGVTADDEGKLRIWNLADGVEIRSIAAHDGSVLSLIVLPDGKRAISGGSDGEVRLWDLVAGKEIHTFGKQREDD